MLAHSFCYTLQTFNAFCITVSVVSPARIDRIQGCVLMRELAFWPMIRSNFKYPQRKIDVCGQAHVRCTRVRQPWFLDDWVTPSSRP